MDPKEKLREYVDGTGGCTAAAKVLGCKPITLWKFMAGTLGVSRKMAKQWEDASGGQLPAAEFALVEPAESVRPIKRKPRKSRARGRKHRDRQLP